MTALINDVTTVATNFTLVLDDYHLVDTQPIHDAVTFLLNHLPLTTP
jgi:LuxR family maltose regulon positive regulatory protein